MRTNFVYVRACCCDQNDDEYKAKKKILKKEVKRSANNRNCSIIKAWNEKMLTKNGEEEEVIERNRNCFIRCSTRL